MIALSITLKFVKKARKGGGKSQHIVIPLPKEAGISEGDEVIISILSNGKIIIEKKTSKISEEDIIKVLREGVEAKGFSGETIEDISRRAYEKWS